MAVSEKYSNLSHRHSYVRKRYDHVIYFPFLSKIQFVTVSIDILPNAMDAVKNLVVEYVEISL